MKLTVFLVFLLVTTTYADGVAQRVSLSLRNVSLETVFAAISKQTGHRFMYTDDVVKDIGSVDVKLQEATIDVAVREVLKGHDLTYRIIAETVLVNREELQAAAHTAGTAAHQQHSVSGTVRDVDGEPLSGVTVSVKGQQGSIATTDAVGGFRVTVTTDAVLVFSYLGYRREEVEVGDQASIAITMEQTVSELEEVEVIATGYQNLDRKLFTGSATTLKVSDVERNGIPDISRMLEGQVAGVSIQNVSGTFGAAPKIRIRGATSLSGENKPLWVVDGIILEDVVNISNEALSTGDPNTLIGSSVAGLNPDDIESFTILKDAAATALYGARAMNGVIVVTTKKGSNTDGAPQVNYSGNYTTYIKPNYGRFDIMNSADQMGILIDMENKGYLNHSAVSRAAYGGIFTKMYNQMYDYDEATDSFALRNDLASRQAFLTRYANANTDWFDLLFKNSFLQEHSLSLNTGTAKSRTYASTSFMNDNGQTVGDNVKRFTASLRNNFTFSDKFSAEILINGSIRDQQTPGTLSRESDPVFGQYSRDFDINPYSYALNTSRLITPYDENGDYEFFVREYAPFNILNELDNNYMTLKMLELKVQGGIRYKIIPELTYSINGAYRYANTERQHYVLEGSNMAEAFRANGDATINGANRFLYHDPDHPNDPNVVILPNGGFFNTSNNNLVNYYFRQDLEYNATINGIHSLNAFGSMEVRFTDRQNHAFDGVGIEFGNGNLVNPNYRYYKKMIEAGDAPFNMWYTYNRFAAFSFRGAYAYGDRYSVNFTTRYDGSNRLGRSQTARWLPTWNISGAWTLDQEPFFVENDILTAARFRATYGLVGNIGSSTNAQAVFFNQITYRPYEAEKEGQITISSLENSELTWEKLKEFNVGADLSLFNDRLDITFDYYDRKIFDLIGQIRTSGIGGQFTKTANYATMESGGVELTVGGRPISQQGAFQWRTQINFGYNKTKITDLEVDPNIWTLVRAEGGALDGHPHRGLFSIDFDKLDAERGYPTYVGTEGDRGVSYIYLQSDDVDYLKYHGPVDPKLSGGFYNQFRYKNFSLSTLFTFAYGNYVRLQPDYSVAYYDLYTVSKDMLNRWVFRGDEVLTVVPSIVDGYTAAAEIYNGSSTVDARYPYNAYNYSSERVARGDFIRLKNVSLSYVIPSRISEKLRMRTAQVSLVGNNIALLYSDKKLNGVDPEFFSNGGVALPIPNQYTLSLKVGF